MIALSRRQLLAGAAAAAALPRTAAAQPRRYGLTPVEVADGLWMIEGKREVFSRENGGDIVNIALLATDQGALVIDSGSTAAMGAEIRAFADQRLGGLLATVNTHHHPDHWFGNAPLADRPVLALAATAATCAEFAQDYAETLYSILGSWISGTRTLPATGTVEAGPASLAGAACGCCRWPGTPRPILPFLTRRRACWSPGIWCFWTARPACPTRISPPGCRRWTSLTPWAALPCCPVTGRFTAKAKASRRPAPI